MTGSGARYERSGPLFKGLIERKYIVIPGPRRALLGPRRISLGSCLEVKNEVFLGYEFFVPFWDLFETILGTILDDCGFQQRTKTIQILYHALK